MIKIKSKSEIDAMREAGRISAKVLRMVGARVAPGVSTLELDQLAENIIRLEGAIPAFKGYGGFPGSICASVNDAVVHGIPSADVILQEGDIISIDTGAIIDGWVGDNAWTFPVGKISKEKQRLLDVTESCMWAAIDAARAGNRLGDIGHACQTIAEKAGYGVVREYVGHGIGHEMHEDPAVPNYGSAHSGLKLEEGMTFAIEPMINMGTYKIVDGDDGWLVTTADGLPSAHFEKTVAICDGDPIILTNE
ncbi:MAG: type I methionyl aminopeptidase [Coriobacteriia bacterium]|nr:type I methionyl aminopeptidase [Coriobacteriia bacterium]